MPDINNRIKYNDELKELIREKRNDANFDYTNWGDADLLELRVAIRDFYRDEQEGICCYCKNSISLHAAGNAYVEHIVPKSKMECFIFEPKNLCTICADCNQIKSSKEVRNDVENPLVRDARRYPRTTGAFKIYHPHFDIYEDHIFKSGDLFFDISPKGSFTIHACTLNRRAHEYGITPDILSLADLREIMRNYLQEENYTRQQILFNRLQNYFTRLGGH